MMLKPTLPTLLKQRPALPRTRTDAPEKRIGTVPRVWALTFAAFFLLGAAWALAMPYDGPPDELQHVTRAYGVAAGQIYAGPVNSKVRTAKSLVPRHVGCFRWKADVSARCMQTPGSNVPSRTKRVSYKSDASGYNPSYYLFVGPVLHIWPDMRGIIVARLLTDAEISALLASALAIAWRSRDRWLIAGIAVCVTPVVVNLMGAVNPAGVEIGAAVALWVSLLDLLEPRPVRPLVVAVALWSGSLLAVTRGFGVGWLVAIAAVCAFGASRARLRTLWQAKQIRWTALGIAVASAAAIAWDLLAGANFDLSAANAPKTKLVQVIAQELWVRVPYYLDGMVRLTSYGDILVPQTLSAIWFGVLGLIVLGGFWLGTTRARIQIAAIIGVSLVMLIVTDVDAVRQGFWFSQGRYALPLLAGAPMIGAVQIGRSNALAPERIKSLLRLIAIALLPLQMVALWSSMLRFQHGFPTNGRLPLNVLTGTWLPPYGPLLPLLLMTAGLAILAGCLCGTPSLRPRFRPSLTRGFRTLDRVIVRFVLVGAAVYAIDMTALWLLHAHAGLPLAISTTLAFCCAFVANLTLNRTFTFGAPGSVGLQGAKLLATAGLNYLSTLLIVLGLAEFWRAYLVSKTIATAINAAFNYVLYRHWVFAPRQDPDLPAPRPRITPTPAEEAPEEAEVDPRGSLTS